jgi:hypothetical protein
MAVARADRSVQVLLADDQQELDEALKEGADLLLLNRELGYGFDVSLGVELIPNLRARYPRLRLMLISNYAEAQAQAVKAGALPGFGKREIGSPRVNQLIQDALGEAPIAEPVDR